MIQSLPSVYMCLGALTFLQLAEAGHEVAQSNLAHLLDRDHIKLFLTEASEKYDSEDLVGTLSSSSSSFSVYEMLSLQDEYSVLSSSSSKTDSISLMRLLSRLEKPNASGRVLAQRFYEMSAEQGSPSSELRLGDFA